MIEVIIFFAVVYYCVNYTTPPEDITFDQINNKIK